MSRYYDLLVIVIVVVTLVLFLASIVWRLYHGGRPYDADRE